MAYKCAICRKGVVIGKTSKHHPGVAGGRWKHRAPKKVKLFRPNLHYARIKVGNNLKRVRLCTKCLRTVKESAKNKKEVVSSSQPPSAV